MNAILYTTKKAIRIIMNLSFNETTKEHFKTLKIMTV